MSRSVMQAEEKDELPVLSSVVKSGNAAIIESTRLGHRVIDELDGIDFEQPDLATGIDASLDALSTDAPSTDKPPTDLPSSPHPETLEAEIDATIDRHLEALRQDLRRLLLPGRRTG